MVEGEGEKGGRLKWVRKYDNSYNTFPSERRVIWNLSGMIINSRKTG